MSTEEVIIRFDNVTFKYSDKKVTLEEANFNVRKNSKITITGQNGAGKSTIFKLIMGELKPTKGQIHIKLGSKIGIARQMIPHEDLDLSLLEFFQKTLPEKQYGIERDIKDVMSAVNLTLPTNKKVRELSGGQKARLLLAQALIQDPDILLLDEPTNNLDVTGIEHLTAFLQAYTKTVIVISHDATFLSAFTDGILNLDIYTHKVDQFVGDYYDALYQMEQQRERERLNNARIEKSIQNRFEKVNKLGGKSVAMRKLANKVREEIEEDREDIVDIRKEEKTLPDFDIPAQHVPGTVMKISQVSFLKNEKPTTKDVNIELFRGDRLIIKGPNGIGKSTLLKSMLEGKGVTFNKEVRIGYYSQDFSELDFNQTPFESLKSVMAEFDIPKLYGTAGRFMLSGEMLNNPIGSLSEGQKGLLCYARFMLQEPGLLIMDEPTNHINYRHIPVIAEAINNYKGALILVSHLDEFVWQLKIDKELDLAKY